MKTENAEIENDTKERIKHLIDLVESFDIVEFGYDSKMNHYSVDKSGTHKELDMFKRRQMQLYIEAHNAATFSDLMFIGTMCGLEIKYLLKPGADHIGKNEIWATGKTPYAWSVDVEKLKRVLYEVEEPQRKSVLKPCPFCGKQPNSCAKSEEGNSKLMYRIVCDDGCGAKSEWYITELIAAEEWNRRVEPIGNSDELPGWLRDAINSKHYSVKEPSQNGNSIAFGFSTALEWVLDLDKKTSPKYAH